MGESRKKYEKLPSYANPQPFGGHQRSGEDIVCAIRNNGNNMRETVKMIIRRLRESSTTNKM